MCINLSCKSKINAEEKKEIKAFEQQKIGKKCPKCGKDLVIRKSMYGTFIGCSGYPKCRHTEKLDASNGKKSNSSEEKMEERKEKS